MRLQGKVAVVTGGNSGIGLAAAREFKGQGASVVIFGRNKESLESAAASIGSGTLSVQGDVTNVADLDGLFRQTQEQHGKIDVLFANAGVAPVIPFDQVDEAFFDQTSDINFKGVYFTVQRALPYLNDNASVILNSSVANQKGLAGLSVYNATKAAVRSLARSFSAELLPRGIRVNVLSPGAIQTPIFEKMGIPKEAVEEFGKNITSQIPVKRIGTAEEMAKAALFLASSDSSYVVGAELIADGGMTQI